MGYITTPLFNILRTSGEDITTPAGIYAAAMETIFDTDGILSPINENYRTRLVTGFGLHYFRDEIGQETVPLFKMSVNEKIYNNAEEINSIFDNLDKQIYKRYAVHHAERQDNSQETSAGQEQNSTNENSAGNSHDINNDKTQGNRTHADSQQSIGKQTSAEAGNENRQAINQSKGADSQSNSNSETSQDHGTQGGGYTDTHSNANNTNAITESDSNSVAASLDTPQGSISAIRTPAGQTPATLKGTGVDAELSAPYRYLTAASSNDGTTVSSDESHISEQGTAQHMQNLTSDNNGTRQSNGASVGQHEQAINSNEQSQHGRQSQSASEDNLQAQGSEHNDSQSNGERINQHADTRQSNDNRQRIDTKSGASNGQDSAIDYEITNEMLNEYIPLMSRLWKIFDPCFCMLLD